MDWLFKRKTVSRLESQVNDLHDRVFVLNRLCEGLRKENEQQRMLVTALRDVNASLDARCNDLERIR
jgi:hypothetical protein